MVEFEDSMLNQCNNHHQVN